MNLSVSLLSVDQCVNVSELTIRVGDLKYFGHCNDCCKGFQGDEIFVFSCVLKYSVLKLFYVEARRMNLLHI